MRMKLTDAAIAKLKPPPKGKQLNVYDAHTPGLVLQIGYGGRRTWKVRHYVNRPGKDGKRVSVTTSHKLGSYPTIGLKEAREKARRFDPLKAKAVTGGTFKEVAEDFLVKHVKAEGLRSAPEIERLINKHILPHWADRTFVSIKRSDVTALRDRVEDENGRRQAGKVLAIIGKMTNWYAIGHDDYASPVVRGMRYSNRKRNRWLDNNEIHSLWSVTEGLGTFGVFVRTLLVTGQRRTKVATLRWQDVTDGVWRIPRELREKGTPERLKLPPLVLDAIEALPRIVGSEYVFAGNSGGPFTSFYLHKQALDAKLQLAPWVLHDLRRTARKLMTRARVRGDVAELALGHSIKGVQAHYDDPTEYQPMIDAAVQAVADQIERIIGGNVVRLPTRAS